ncbi:heavy metal translocating P-type ATPase [Modicisalibacter luteus]|uniref:P-type Zn(2+) transporter n=1 Tax=Modicisalibacter luteus TaxID=453962 RepID=A0ABV7M1Q0_9GAMM|nr:heavy metal translocating P-type ATPase [Halomonas lutea]GHB08301.1 heavy metal-transporting ATPase [Halomonas lutea]
MATESASFDITHQWIVQGMDCPSCATRIRGAVERLAGVQDVQVSVTDETLSLRLDTDKTSPTRVERTVEALGYGIALQTDGRQGAAVSCCQSSCCGSQVANSEAESAPADDMLSWHVEGMDCPSCVTKVRGAVERLPGVADVRVSLMRETLSLHLDEARISRTDVEREVARLGYRMSRQGDAQGAGDDLEPSSFFARMKRGLRSGKARLVLLTGALLLGALVVSLLAPAPWGDWAFALACLVGVVPVAQRAFAALRAGMPFTIEMLMTLAAGGALVIGAAEEAALVIFLFAVGEVLEGVAADRARAGIRALGNLVPRSARVEENGDVRQVDAARLRIGQVVQVRPGDRMPADGEIIEGSASLDESPVTGESLPKSKGVGQSVYAGSINTDAVLRVQVTKAPEDNTIARIIRLVEEAQEARAPTERFIDRFSRVYMPAVVGTAVLVAVVPPLMFGGAWGEWVYRALALLLIGCPCALVISVPASIASSLSTGARHGLLMKGGAVIETAARTTLVAFDKTGTLTNGKPEITDVDTFKGGRNEVIALAAAVESGSSHPLAAAILAHAETQNIRVPQVSKARVIAGHGVEAHVENVRTVVASPRYAEEAGILTDTVKTRITALEDQGKTVAVVFREDALAGIIALRDEPRTDAAQGVKFLSAQGVRSVMLTGDNPRTAAAIADGLGLEYRASLLPDDKVAAIRELTASEHVMMVGDGINDAPALATAHVGVAMGSGTDVALETADGALLRNRVVDVAAKIGLARATMANIHQNIAIALGLKGIFLITTVFGITGLWLAILADTGATVLVTLNALRLLRFDPWHHLGIASATPGTLAAPAASTSDTVGQWQPDGKESLASK